MTDNSMTDTPTTDTPMTDTGIDRDAEEQIRAARAAAEGTEPPTPSQSGSAGGGMALDVGRRDEAKGYADGDGEGIDPPLTRVQASDKPGQGASTKLPNRDGGHSLHSNRP